MSYFGIPIRNGLPIGLGSVAPLASGGGSPFSPLSLFAGGAPGAWYDPSDYTTLFQDSAGTTPVTAVEQPVGLMLDKSQGLVLGSERKADFVTDIVGTVTAATYNTTTGVGSLTRVDASNQSYVTLGSLSSGFYKATISCQTGSIIVRAGAVTGTQQAALSAGQTLDVYVNTVNRISISHTTSAGSSTFTITSVKELPGNHAFQATSASRPVLSARYNLLTKTEDLSDAAWTKLGAAVSSTDTIIATSAFGAVYETPSKTATATQFILTVEFAAGTVSAGRLTIAEAIISTAGVGCDFTLTGAGSAGTPAAYGAAGWVAGPATIQSIGDGWYRCTLTATSSTTTAISGVAGHTGTAILGNTIKARKTSLVPSNQSGLPYQRVNTATDYATTGFLPYLRFDGVDDSLSTNSISFTATDKMSVFAGVRKLVDQSNAILVELSASVGVANPGSFNIHAPISTGANYASYLVGTGAIPSTNTLVTTYTAPITNVVTVQQDIAASGAAAEIRFRINAVSNTGTSFGDAGTGNFGNYPLYIGRRNNASLPFNGQMYSMIIVGKAVTAGELSSTETYVNQKTGAY